MARAALSDAFPRDLQSGLISLYRRAFPVREKGDGKHAGVRHPSAAAERQRGGGRENAGQREGISQRAVL